MLGSKQTEKQGARGARSRPHPTIAEVMDADPPTVTPETTLYVAAGLFLERDVGDLVVVDSSRHVLGLLSTDDVHALVGDLPKAMREEPTAAQLRATPVRILLSKVITTTKMDTPLYAAAFLLAHRDVNLLPVVDTDERLVGAANRIDVIESLSHASPSQARPPQP